jgi:hypothetical protein
MWIEGESTSTDAAETTIEAPTDPQAADLAAFSKGADEVGATPSEKPVEAVGATGAEHGTADAATGATAAAVPAEQKEEAPKDPAKEFADAELKKVNDELKALGRKPLNEVSAERFRALNETKHKFEALSKEIEPLREKAEASDRMNEVIADCGATPNQIGSAFLYLKQINSGDPGEMRKALKVMTAEVNALAKHLGESVEGIDPVADHQDLRDQIEAAALTPEAARELARSRANQKLEEQRRTTEAERQRADTEHRSVVDNAMSQVNAFNAQVKTSDPHFAAKLEALKASGTFELIRDNMHPSKWPQAIAQAYAKIPDPKPALKVGEMPLRPTGTASQTMARQPKDDYEAFGMGAASVR